MEMAGETPAAIGKRKSSRETALRILKKKTPNPVLPDSGFFA